MLRLLMKPQQLIINDRAGIPWKSVEKTLLTQHLGLSFSSLRYLFDLLVSTNLSIDHLSLSEDQWTSCTNDHTLNMHPAVNFLKLMIRQYFKQATTIVVLAVFSVLLQPDYLPMRTGSPSYIYVSLLMKVTYLVF